MVRSERRQGLISIRLAGPKNVVGGDQCESYQLDHLDDDPDEHQVVPDIEQGPVLFPRRGDGSSDGLDQD